MRKKKTIDEIFKFGTMEISRSGKLVSLSCRGDKREKDENIKIFSSQYKNVVLQIENLISEIKDLISSCNPLEVLKYGYDNFINSIAGIASEVQLSRDDVYRGRELEYIQSVIVSSENQYIEENNEDLEKFELISSKIKQLYTLTQNYFIYRTAELKVRNDIDFDLEEEKFLFEAQSSMFIRGDRYQIYEIPHLKELLNPHNDEFIKLYNITVDDFIDGISNIQKSLTSVKNSFISMLGDEGNLFFDFIDLFDKYEKFENEELKKNSNKTMEEIVESFKESINLDKYREINEYDIFDLQKLTNWPRELLEDFSFKINENKYFYNNEYSGYPLIELPVFERPFINIEDKFYCFDYYNLFDNIYRVVQKVFRKKDSSYKEIWGIKQMEVTEKMVGNLFEKILPGCIIYKSNYYPKNKSLKQCNENDILVLYDDNLIIVEVKAGSYTYRAPIVDIDSHIKSLKTLVEKADGQAERTLNYLKSDKIVKFYNSDKSEKCEISLENFNDITLMTLTLDNFNEFSSKIEKLKFLNINKNSIAVSIDDFRVYSDYFDSPLEFLHYLKQRKLATKNKALYLNDELDHLGMYIEHNLYSKTFENVTSGQIIAYGYREEIDKYFSSLINENLKLSKPKQKIPSEIKKIIRFLDKSNKKNKVRLATFLLDICSEAREEINDIIIKALIRQTEIKRMLQINLTGETPMCIFCHQQYIKNMSYDESRDYTFATMIQMEDNYRIELHLFYDGNDQIKDVEFEFLKYEDIPKERIDELKKIGDRLSVLRIEKYKKENGKRKIGRNELCPCGSGKKYKKCHGK